MIDPTTVENAGRYMAGALGLSWPEDRTEVVEYLNRYRNLLYNLYPQFNLFDDAFHCICIDTFPTRCRHSCTCAGLTYQGFTLPNDVVGVEAAWENGNPLFTRSRWREAHTGFDKLSTPRIEVVETGEVWATERALTKVGPLMVFTEHEEDAGKRVVVEAVTAKGSTHFLQFNLESDGWVKVPRHIQEIRRVSLPSDLVGSVTLAQEDGRELSVYEPWETAPAYRLFKVASRCDAGAVRIQGTKKFKRVYFDHDIVEVGDQLVIEAAGSFLKYRNNTVDIKEIKRAEYDRTEMATQLKGLIARHRGNSIQDGSPLKGRRVNITRPQLGYEKR